MLPWLKNQFRGWSIVHCLLDLGAASVTTVLASAFATLSPLQAAGLFVSVAVVVGSAIALSVRRGEHGEGARLRECKQAIQTQIGRAPRFFVTQPKVERWRDTTAAMLKSMLRGTADMDFRSSLSRQRDGTALREQVATAKAHLVGLCACITEKDLRTYPH